jgi:NAD(P)-dependent dehydrogenase (short-subunit alcohol dehydrogenase family)
MAVIGITGSTDGIGRATAGLLLADGHRVLVRTRSREPGGTRCEGNGWRRRSGGWRPGAD